MWITCTGSLIRIAIWIRCAWEGKDIFPSLFVFVHLDVFRLLTYTSFSYILLAFSTFVVKMWKQLKNKNRFLTKF